MAKIIMSDGMVIEGTAEELAQMAKTYGEGAESSVRVIEGDPQVGDKIRITRTVMAGSDYEIGDVLTVQYIYPDNDVRVEENRRLILRREFEIIGRNSDYPTTDERIDSLETRVTALEEGAEDSGEDEVIESEKRSAKVGEKIIITNADAQYGQTYKNGDILEVTEEEAIDFRKGSVRAKGITLHIRQDEYEVISDDEDSPEEYVIGDKVRLIYGVGNGSLFGFEDGDICDVLNTSSRYGDKMYLKSPRGIFGYAKPIQVEKIAADISESKYSPRDVVRGDSGNLYVLYCRCPENDYAGEGIAWRANGSYFGWIGEDQIEKVSDEITSATPKVGDKVIVVKTIVSRGMYAVGDVLTVVEVDSVNNIRVEGIDVGLLSSEFKVVEIVPDAPTFEVGDYAKVVGRTFAGDLTTGSIVKITKEADCDGEYRAELLDGSDYDHAPASSLEKLSEKEAKFAKIGRKVDEYKDGDIVRVVIKSGNVPVGTIGEVGDLDKDSFRVNTEVHSIINWSNPKRAELITPVERRFDK